MKNIIVLLILLSAFTLFGQAKLFEGGNISDDQVFGLAMSPDGGNLLFVKAYGGRDSLHLYQSTKVNGHWESPELAFFSDKKVNQIDPSYSPDGDIILFNALISEEKGYDVFTIERTAEGWAKPKELDDAINTSSHEFYATMANSKNIYFTRRKESNDIYVSYWKNGKYQKAIPINGNINTDYSDSNPYISPDEDYLVFISNRKGGFGNADLYISFQKNNKWSNPINIGNQINTADSEFCPTVDLKNDKFFFSRTIIENERRIENIYSIPLKNIKIKKLKKRAKWD